MGNREGRVLWGAQLGKNSEGKLCNQSLAPTSNSRKRRPEGEFLGVFSAKGRGDTREECWATGGQCR